MSELQPMMANLQWTVISETKDHIIGSAETDYGRWTISTIKNRRHYAGELYREVKLSIRLDHPSLTFVETVQRLSELRGGDPLYDEEIDHLRHFTMSHDIGNFQSWRDARMMADMLHEGDAALPSFIQMMANFNIRHKFENSRGTVQIFTHDIVKNLELTLIEQEGTFDVNLGNSRGHYNLGALYRCGREYYGGLGLSALPAQVSDYRRVGLRWMNKMIEQRKARGGMFRKPIIDESDRYPLGDLSY